MVNSIKVKLGTGLVLRNKSGTNLTSLFLLIESI